MRSPGSWLAAAATAAALSCNWGAFDDLKDDAWVQQAERVDTQTGGDYGVEIVALPPASGTMGIRYIVAAGSSPAGLAQATFGPDGKLVEQIGFNGEVGGKGALEPMTDTSTIFSLAPFSGDSFIAGAPTEDMLIRYEAGLRNGTAILDNGPELTGRKIVTGNLGLGSATIPDVVTVGQLSLTIIGDGTMAPITCALKPPNQSNQPVVPLESLAIANVNDATPHDEILVGHRSLVGDLPRILVLDPGSVQNGTNCSESSALVMPDGNPPVSIQVAQLDGTGPLDMVTGTLRQGEGSVRVFLNPTYAPGSTPASMEIPVGDDEEASGVRGGRIRIADIDGGAEPEIIVADSAATMEGISLAGNVQIFKLGACSGEGDARGPLCLVRTLYDPTPARNDQFGRALAVGTFTGAMTKTILAVAQKGKLWVYYRVSASGTDPRQK